MSKDDNESAEDARLRTLAELAPKSGHVGDKYFASLLQSDVIQTEFNQINKGLDHYDETTVNQAIVHSRQDTVLMVSYLTSNNKLLHRINKQLSIIVGVILVAVGFVIWSLL
ncbi:hypothetical protein OAS48_00725 [Gammaproteobacteria bacterium]|nr:hypothetical protein [Gammaproteobacteria bacterium]